MIVTIGDETNGLAVDTSAGGRICSLVIHGLERLLSLPAQGIEPSIGWGCYLMAPFAGRIKGASLYWAGRNVALRRNHGAHSIHGAGFDADWSLAARSQTSLTLTREFEGSSWPFKGSMTQRIELAADRLTLQAEIHALEPMPAAIGWHPWFQTDAGPIRVILQSDAVLGLDRDLVPTGELVPVDARTDLRSGPSLEGRRIDDVYTGVCTPVSVSWPDLELTMNSGPSVCAFVVYTHPQAVCVEPMTAWPDAVRLAADGHDDTGLVSLEAGETLAVSTEWSWKARVPEPRTGS